MKRVLVILCVAIAGALMLLLLTRCEQPLPTLVSSASNQVGSSLGGEAPVQKRATKGGANEEFGPNTLSIASLLSSPIVFYGKVQSQNGSPIGDAEVQVSVADKVGGGSSKHTTKSDKDGLFTIVSKGMALSVYVSKEGFFSIPWKEGGSQRSRGTFDYAANFGSGIHKPDEKAPVIFTLLKPPAIEPLNRIREKETVMPKDGEPVRVSLDISAHALELKCWTSDLKKERDGRYDWKLEVAVVGGGIQRRGESYDFTAPSDGYGQTDLIEMPRTLRRSDWQDDFEQSYWVRFNDGLFGTIKVRMIAGGAHYSIVSGYINPSPGSRNLAASPSKRK